MELRRWSGEHSVRLSAGRSAAGCVGDETWPTSKRERHLPFSFSESSFPSPIHPGRNAFLTLHSPPMSDLSPTTRSRTLLFISYRDSRSTATRFSRPRLDTNASNYGDSYTPDDERQGLISPKAAAGHVAIEINLPPKWYILLQILRYHISISPPLLQISFRVDLSDQVEEILTGTQSKSAFFVHVVPLAASSA
jgi:hypothetical protein